MKSIFMAMVLAIVWIGEGMACDICGCSIQGGAFGILPQYHTSFVGLRYQMARFSYPGYGTTDRLQQTELWTRFYPIDRLQVLASLPYRIHQRISDSEIRTLHGLGDGIVMLNYSLYATPDTVVKKFNQNLFIGGGIKLPIATISQDKASDLPANFQLGTGSWDGLFTLQYQARIRNWGINPQLTYRRNSANPDKYRYGDQLSAAMYAYHWLSGMWWMLMPYTGVSAEWIARDVDQNYYQNDTGGQGAFWVLGSDWYTKHIALGASYQHPIQQSYANDEITAHARFTFSLSVLF